MDVVGMTAAALEAGDSVLLLDVTKALLSPSIFCPAPLANALQPPSNQQPVAARQLLLDIHISLYVCFRAGRKAMLQVVLRVIGSGLLICY